ncbi:MAG: NTP transferase domain-containing protein [Candidatus Cloacimonetes bacterium]|nr:NTP transferase domain-containing protein [Candidatus Cloacimonadota bacterium]
MKKIYAVILAAGYSSRFSAFKPFAKYKDEYFIVTILKKLSFFCEKIFIVTGFNAKLLEKKLNDILQETELSQKISFVFNHNFPKGMFSSIQIAAKKVYEIINQEDYAFLHLVDQPQISILTYEKLAEFSNKSDNSIIIPSFQHKAGHPILLKKSILKKIIDSDINETLRNVLENYKADVFYVNVDDSAVIKDFNKDEDISNFCD